MVYMRKTREAKELRVVFKLNIYGNHHKFREFITGRLHGVTTKYLKSNLIRFVYSLRKHKKVKR